MNKHAYLVMAHHQFPLLQTTLRLLDDPRNDFFIHIDKKAGAIDFEEIRRAAPHSRVTFIERLSVHWGGYSQIRCELALLQAATQAGQYAYYHLISGVDLPLRTAAEIHTFFDAHPDREYVHFASLCPAEPICRRISQYHFFTEKSRKSRFCRGLERRLGGTQSLFGVDRLRKSGLRLAFGAQWFSITDDLARYVLCRRRWIAHHFRFGDCADELFLQTLVVNSPFFQRTHAVLAGLPEGDYRAAARNIDWTRGQPYVWRSEDLSALLASDFCFARKFDLDIDAGAVQVVARHLMVRGEKTRDACYFPAAFLQEKDLHF